MAFEKLADVILRHSKLVILAWIVILLCAAPFALKAGDNLSYDMNEMAGTDSEAAIGLEIIGEHYSSGLSNSSSMAMLVLTYDTQQGKTDADALVGILSDDMSSYSAPYEDSSLCKILSVSAMMTFDGDKEDSGMILVAIAYDTENMEKLGIIISDDIGNIREWVNSHITEDTYNHYLTGSPAIGYDVKAGAMDDISHIDVFSIALILILVGLFFRSFFSSAMPPITIGLAIAIAFCGMYFLSCFLNLFFITEMFIIVGMLGAGCDYCIFIMARYKEELRKGATHEHAMKEAIIWAGESITTSGISVMIGFGAMSICSFTLVSGMGLMLALGIFIALMAALTLITSILNILGARIFWPSKIDSFSDSEDSKGWYSACARFGNRYFHKSVRFSIRHAKAIIVASILVTVPMAYVMVTNEDSFDMIGLMLTGESQKGLQTIEEYTDGGIVMPDYIMIETDGDVATAIEIPFNEDNLTGVGTVKVMDLTVQYMMKGYSMAKAREMAEAEVYANMDELTPLLEAIPALGLLTWTNENAKNSALAIGNSLNGLDDNIGQVVGIFDWKSLSEDANARSGNTGRTDVVFGYILYGADLTPDTEDDNPYGLGLEPKTYVGVAYAAREFVDSVLDYVVGRGNHGEWNDPYFIQAMDYLVNKNGGVLAGETTSGTTVLTSPVLKSNQIVCNDYSANYIKITVITCEQSMSDRSMSTLNAVSKTLNSYIEENPDNGFAQTYLTGTAAVMLEMSEDVNKEFVKVIILAIILIFILLFFVMRSYLTPIRSLVTILMSVVWTIGIEHLLFTNAMGAGVIWLVPIVLIVICLGLGMDYDILLTTRIKENHLHKGMSNDDAIEEAVVNSGSVITICGLIMGGAFGTLMMSSMTLLQEFGFALCFAIVVDALIVRTYIVPAAMHLMGEWCWKGPKFMHRNIKTVENKDSE